MADDRLSASDLAEPRRTQTASGGEAQPSRDDEGVDQERPLLAGDDLEGFRERWESIQVGFVDQPRDAVSEADGLVAEVMQRLADTFAQERSRLEEQWDRGDDVSTEDLRVALQRYRTFFHRLLRT